MVQAYAAQSRIRGWWMNDGTAGGNDAGAAIGIHDAIQQINCPIFLVEIDGKQVARLDGHAILGNGTRPEGSAAPILGFVPALSPETLGDPVFKAAHGLTYPYVAGAMANGISSVELVAAMGNAGMIGFFGAGGLRPDQIEDAIVALQQRLDRKPFGFNLIHSPYDQALEAATVDLYLKRGIQCVSAAAFLDLTLPLIHYRLKGIHRNRDGQVVCPNRVVAKVSRIEVARKFFSPAPDKLIRQLVNDGRITAQEAELSQFVPVAHDLTAEADSGGHTDNRSAITLLPTMLALRDELQARHQYQRPLVVGLAGGIATPDSAAAAFAMGAGYVLTGTVNQACAESGTSNAVRCMLAEACQADVIMTPSADMFEMGVKVQVLKRGTMFPLRAAKLYEFYSAYESLETIPAPQRKLLEQQYFHKSIEEEWAQTRAFFQSRDPGQITAAERDPKHKMALVFRSYLGQSCGWAQCGDPLRRMDYQIWCGPAIGAFNEWTRGSFLEKAENRTVVTVAMNLLVGATMVTRIGWLRGQGISLPPEVTKIRPMPLDVLKDILKQKTAETGMP